MKYWDRGWNPIIGCVRCSEGCLNCISLASSKKRNRSYTEGEVLLNTKVFERPIGVEGEFIYIGSQSDIFVEPVTDDILDGIFSYVEGSELNQRYLICTKRAERMRDYLENHDLSKEYYFGVSVENQERFEERFNFLREIKYKKVLVLEPLLEKIVLSDDVFDTVSWIVIGRESGKARRFLPTRVLNEVIEQVDGRVPVFCTDDRNSHKEFPF